MHSALPFEDDCRSAKAKQRLIKHYLIPAASETNVNLEVA